MSIEVRCVISDKNSSWEETLRVGSLETAEKDIKSIISIFNADLRPGEKVRKFVSIIAEKKFEDKTKGEKITDFHLLLAELSLENLNVAGSAWLKSKYKLIMNAYNTLLETGKSRAINKYVKEILNTVSRVSDRFGYFRDIDIVELFKPEENK